MANQTSEQYTENLFQAIDTIIANRVSKLPYDQTIICEITNADNAEYGRYLVKAYNQSSGYNDVSFTAYSDNTEYTVGDRIYVRIPAGDFTQQKVITGNYIAESADSALINTDAYWIAESIVLDDSGKRLTPIFSNTIYELQDGEIFPGYSVCRIKFQPVISQNLIGINYSVSDLDVKFKITADYSVPTILNSSIFTSEFTISVRAYNPNLFRNSNKLLSYDINLDELVGAPIQLRRITLSDLRYAGTKVDENPEIYQNYSLEFSKIDLSFGYYITNNIGQFLTLYTDNIFYDPSSSNTTHDIYAHYYYSTDLQTKRLEPIEGLEDQFKVSFDGTTNIQRLTITEEPDIASYRISLPVSNTDLNTLNNKRDSYVVYVADAPEDNRILAQDSINLINVNFYSNLDNNINNTGTFLTAKALTADEEDIANYNNGIYYIYGQDGKPTDSSASFITRRAYVKIISYSEGKVFDNDHLSVSMPSNNTMIIPVNTTPVIIEDNTVAYVEFKISNYYAQNKKNNTITWSYTTTGVNGNVITYTYDQELLFGYSGSQGADYSLILTLTDSSGKEIPAITMQDASYRIVPHLYDYNNNEIASTGITYSKVNTSGGGTGNNPRWPSWLTLSGENLTVSGYVAPSEATPANYYCAVVKATIESLSIEAFMPIAVASATNTSLSGPATITYDITGKKPFTSKLPYKLYTNSSSVASEVTATLIIPKANASDALKTLYPRVDNNSLSLPSAYSTEMTNWPPTIVIKQGTNVVWIQPLYIWQNKYPNSMTNGEANKVIIPEQGVTEERKIINTNVGRVLSNGAGMFIGDYGTATRSQYGLYAFKQISNSDKVKNIFKLTADGDFSGTGDFVFNDIRAGARQATAKDLVTAINTLKDILLTLVDDPDQQTALNNINLEIRENG